MNLLKTKLKQTLILLSFAIFFINLNNAKADSHDNLSEDLKQSLSNVINENLSEDLQKAIVKYVSVISNNIAEDEKTKLLQSTKEMLSISANGEINDFAQVYDLLVNLEIIIDIIYPYILDEMSNQNIPNNLQINAWLAFSDLKTAISNFDQSQIKNSLKVISKALVADSITEANQEVAEDETETENAQNNESKTANYNVDDEKEVIGKVQKSGKKGFFVDDIQLKKRNKVSTNTLLTCRESSTGCQFILDKKTSFYLKNKTKIIINSYSVDADGTQFIKACLLEGGFYFKTLRKTNSQLTTNIKNNGTNYYDAVISKGLDAKLGVSIENNLDVVNAGGTNVAIFRIYSENAATKLGNINTSNISDLSNKYNVPLIDVLPSITNDYGDPCINPNFGDISIKVQETNTSSCTHAHAHNENGEAHEDDYDEGNYDLGDTCNADIVIPNILCPSNYSCALNPPTPDDPNPGPSPDPGGDHHEGG